MKPLDAVFQRLGLQKENGLFHFNDMEWAGVFPQKTEYALKRIQPEAIFCFNKEPVILFFESPEDEAEIHKKCWNFNKTPVIIINTHGSVKIYNGFSFDAQKSSLHKLAAESRLKHFSYQSIVTGELWREFGKKLSSKKRLDYKLLKNIEDARNILIEQGNLHHSTANKLIGRLVFTRYLIDRKIKIDYSAANNGVLTNEELLALIKDRDALYDFFEFLNTRFKGDLFPLNGEKEDVTPGHLEVLFRLFRGDVIKTGQRSLFDIYNFDIIPVELVSNIYEYFIGKDKQEKNKSFYTPPFLVDYILEQMAGDRFKRASELESISCKVLDPSCGSGIFLVETLRRQILEYKQNNPHIEASQPEFKESIKALLVDNIFGIDKDKEALEIAVFSLYITLLDFFEEPRDINGFEFPNLLGTNLIEADFFDTRHPFNKNFRQTGFDLILGNPPWGKVKSPYLEYIEARAKEEGKNIKISNKEVAQAFMLRASDFSSPHTVCCLVVTSKILYNLKAREFREYFLSHFYIDEVFEISPVRKDVFTRAVGPAALVKYRFAFGESTGDNRVLHLSLKPNPSFSCLKSILIEKNDIKEIRQKYFLDYDWVWKVLLYGNVLDFYFIKKLKDKKRFTSIDDLLTDEDSTLIIGEGVQACAGDSYDASHLVGRPFIDTDKKSRDFFHFYINPSPPNKWTQAIVHRNRDRNLFDRPLLLVRGTTKPDFTLVACTSGQGIVFTDSGIAIKSFGDKKVLQCLLGIMASEFSTYFMFMTGSSLGVEREQIYPEELRQIPVVLNENLIPPVEELLKLHKRKYNPTDEEFALGEPDAEIERAIKELNALVLKVYELDEKERDLLDYALNVSIPILKGNVENVEKNPSRQPGEDDLSNYARLFVNHFSQFHNDDESGYFQVDIYKTSSLVAMNFSIVREKPINNILWKDNPIEEEVIELLAGMSFQKLSDRLFIQKDVKGIWKDSFYIIKPSQFKYWHRAVARLDIIEFENSMLDSQMEKEKNG